MVVFQDGSSFTKVQTSFWLTVLCASGADRDNQWHPYGTFLCKAHTHTHTHTHTYAHAYTHMDAHTHTHTHTHILCLTKQARMISYTHSTSLYLTRQVGLSVTHTCMQACAHTHTHTHKHTLCLTIHWLCCGYRPGGTAEHHKHQLHADWHGGGGHQDSRHH